MYLSKPNETDFAPTPEGTHAARCYRVVDLGTQQVDWQGQIKQQHKVMLSWELFCDEKMEDGRNFSIHQRYTFSGSEKATFRKHLESWRGKKFDDADFGPGGFNIAKLIGVPCLLSITHTTKGDKVYSNVAAVLKVPKGMEVPPLTNETLFFSLEPGVYSAETLGKLSQGIKDVIRKSPEFAELTKAPIADHHEESMDDEIPF